MVLQDFYLRYAFQTAKQIGDGLRLSVIVSFNERIAYLNFASAFRKKGEIIKYKTVILSRTSRVSCFIDSLNII